MDHASRERYFTSGAIAKRFILNYIATAGGAWSVAVASMKEQNYCDPYSRIIRQAEVEVLWQLKEWNFNQVRRELGVVYGTLRRLLEREIDEGALGFIKG